jgi:DNA-binding PadR family transcriptional regulator
MAAVRQGLLSGLLGDDEHHGADLAKASGGRIGRGRIYVLLSQLKGQGLVTSRINLEDRFKRTLYRRVTPGRES